MIKNFILIGVAGFIAPRHLKAIKETGNVLLATFDPHDSVGVLDSFFPECSFFVEFERFERHIDKLIRGGVIIDYCVICSPNYLHDSHIRFALRFGINVICEKPLVLNPWNAESLQKLEQESKKTVNAILQLRLHPSIKILKQKIESTDSFAHDFDLTYITPRGNWYYTSWKGNPSKSGGIVTNIGIHFFDMLIWLFGEVKKSIVHVNTHDRASGFLELSKARVRWFLSINSQTLPESIIRKGIQPYRTMVLNGKEIVLDNGFNDLHTSSYEQILDNNGFGIVETLPSIYLTHSIRHQSPIGLKGEYHPFAATTQSTHPFFGKT